MIRLIYCINRRQDISIEEFREFWNGKRFLALYNEYNRVFKTARFRKSLVLKIPMNVAIAETEGTRKPYDGIIETWWESAKELLEVNESPEAGKLRQEIASYEDQFVDRSRSTLFFTEYPE